MSKIAIIGDIHLGKGLSLGKPGIGNAINSRINDQLKLLEWIIDIALEYNIITLILAGDIFDEAKTSITDYRLLNLFIEFLQKCESYNIEVHIIAGNHDLKRTGEYYSSVLDILPTFDLKNVHVHKTITTVYSGTTGITLLPFCDKHYFNCNSNIDAINILHNQLQFEILEIPDHFNKILVGHLAIEGSIYFGTNHDYTSSDLMCPINIFSEYDCVWMGHIHTPHVYNKKPHIAHIGSLDISNFGEINQKKQIVIFEEKDKYQYLQVPTRPLKYIRIDVPNITNTTEYVISYIKTLDLNNAIVKVEIHLPNEEVESTNSELIKKEIYNNGAFYICNFAESRKISVVPVSKCVIDSFIEPIEAIKLFAEQENFSSLEEKELYVKTAASIVRKCKYK